MGLHAIGDHRLLFRYALASIEMEDPDQETACRVEAPCYNMLRRGQWSGAPVSRKYLLYLK